MGSKSSIEWTDASWSPLRARVKENAAEIARQKGYTSLVQIAEKMAGHVGHHCEKVSEECANCYSEANNSRCLPANGTGLPFDRRSRDLTDAIVDEKILQQPLHWRKGRRIFVESQADLFGEWVTDEQIDLVFAVMALCPQHQFQVLTKRSRRMREYFEFLRGGGKQAIYDRDAACGWWLSSHGFTLAQCDAVADAKFWRGLPHVWLGVSAGNQAAADERIPDLLATPAAVRFISAEPLLSGLMLQGDGEYGDPSAMRWRGYFRGNTGERRLDWVIAGGESGRGARPVHPMWLRSLRDQCVAAGVPYFFKQWGAWVSVSEVAGRGAHHYFPDGATVRRVGKKKAGHTLDGEVWQQLPEMMP